MAQQRVNTIELIGPEEAARYLQTAAEAGDVKNRTIRNARTAEYARLMKAGLWKLNGETIKFDSNGVLRDGQHRLTAIIDSGCAVWIEVSRNILPEDADFIDMGLPRLPSDVLIMHGVDGSGTLSKACLYQYAWDNDIIQKQRKRMHVKLSGHERLNVLNANPGLKDFALERTLPRGMRRLIPNGLRCWLMYRTYAVDAEKAAEFWEGLFSGSMLSASSPLQKLRGRLIDNLTAAKKMDEIPLAALVIKAWGLFITGEERETIAWRAGEAFPSFDGPTQNASRRAAVRRTA